MVKRATYLVAYDISCPRRLRSVARLVRSHSAEGQKSVQECLLTSGEREALLHNLNRIIDKQIDRIDVFRLDPRQKHILLGIARTFEGGPFIVI